MTGIVLAVAIAPLAFLFTRALGLRGSSAGAWAILAAVVTIAASRKRH